ncbi:MAG: AraC family transcriptional regulator [Alphaproteobacteria bacterium]|nr:MAG: AraC family transcriptional regulator [Alphaproteobacteria bacterium]
MNQLFKIFKVDAADAQRISASPDEPHQHDYEELIIGVEGKLNHFIDFKSTIIEAPLISFVTKGKVHRVIPLLSKGNCNMWVLRFKSEFIAETIFQLYTIYHNNANLELQKGTCFNRLITICEIIDKEMQQSSPDLSIVRHLLSALFIMIESERKKIAASEENINSIQNETFKNFLIILEENFRRPLGVEFYAEKLFMSSRNLNLICQSIMNQSVSEIIDTRKLTEAKNLLATTNKSISEIGFELGFNEKSYFSNVFKKKSGQTPTEFREEIRKLV